MTKLLFFVIILAFGLHWGHAAKGKLTNAVALKRHHQTQDAHIYNNRQPVNITVSDAPKLVGLLDELNNPEGTNATITCSLGSGDLRGLTYEWFKDKDRLASETNKIRVDIPAENYQSVLRIFDLKQTDSALYTCIAKNRFGQDKISTKLNVKG